MPIECFGCLSSSILGFVFLKRDHHDPVKLGPARHFALRNPSHCGPYVLTLTCNPCPQELEKAEAEAENLPEIVLHVKPSKDRSREPNQWEINSGEVYHPPEFDHRWCSMVFYGAFPIIWLVWPAKLFGKELKNVRHKTSKKMGIIETY